jgi:hypothetical protein
MTTPAVGSRPPIVSPDNHGSRERLLALALLAVFTLLFFHRALLAGSFYAIDFHLTFQPLRTILAETLRHQLPFWNDRLGNGSPILANPNNAALYVPNLLCMVLAPARALTVLTVLHLLFGAWGAWLLGRRLGQSTTAAWIGAVLFGFNGAAVAATPFINLAWTLPWLPWLLVATDRTCDEDSAFPAVAFLGLVVGAMIVLGDPFIVAAGCMGSCLWLLARIISRWRRRGQRFRSVTVAAGAALGTGLGLLLALPSLVAVLKYLPASVRAIGFKPEGVTFWSFHPLLGLGFLLPAPFGNPDAVGLERFWAVALSPDRGAPYLIGVYVGGVALCLAALGAAVRSRRRWTLLSWLVALAALALGRYGPLYPLLDEVALFAALRYPEKWILPAMLPLALLAGHGADAVTRMAADRRSWFGVVLFPVVLLTVLAGLALATSPPLDGWIEVLASPPTVDSSEAPIDPAQLGRFRGQLLASIARATVGLLVAVIAVLGLRRRPQSVRTTVVLGVLVAIDLLVHNRQLAPVVSAAFYDQVPKAVEALRSEGVSGRVYVEPLISETALVRGVRSLEDASRQQRELLRGYTGAAYGLRLAFNQDTEGYGPSRYMRLGVLVRSAPLREKLMLLGAAGASHVMTVQPLEDDRVEPVAVVPGITDPPLRVFRNRLVLGRVRLVPKLLVYDEDAGFIRAVGDGPDDLFSRFALVDRRDLTGGAVAAEDLTPAALDRPPAHTGSLTIEEDRGSLIRINSVGDGGYVVVSDCWVPGWTATVDGHAVPILPVDYAFMAVAIPGGTREVVFEYWPW